MTIKHAGTCAGRTAGAEELSRLAPREWPVDAAAARRLPLWEGFAAAGTDLRELPRVSSVRVHAPQADSAVLFVVAAEAKDQTMLVSFAEPLADAMAVSSARGRDEGRSVTHALHVLPVPLRAQWLGLLRSLGWGLKVAPTLSPDGDLSEDEILVPADRALHLPPGVASELARIIKDAGQGGSIRGRLTEGGGGVPHRQDPPDPRWS